MKIICNWVFGLVLALLAPVSWAQDHGTREEARAMAERAVQHFKAVGAEKAFKDFTTDKATWTKKDLYIFLIAFNGPMMAHGANEKLIGKDMTELKDQNGKLFVQEMMAVAKSKGSGWVDYDWQHPQTKKVEGKTSYTLRIPGYEGFLGVGVYR